MRTDISHLAIPNKTVQVSLTQSNKIFQTGPNSFQLRLFPARSTWLNRSSPSGYLSTATTIGHAEPLCACRRSLPLICIPPLCLSARICARAGSRRIEFLRKADRGGSRISETPVFSRFEALALLV
jgi:hypothetical protein